MIENEFDIRELMDISLKIGLELSEIRLISLIVEYEQFSKVRDASFNPEFYSFKFPESPEGKFLKDYIKELDAAKENGTWMSKEDADFQNLKNLSLDQLAKLFDKRMSKIYPEESKREEQDKTLRVAKEMTQRILQSQK